MAGSAPSAEKPLIFVGPSDDELREFPREVRREVGYALYVAQQGDKHPDAEPLHGYKGAGVLDIKEDDDGGKTYRTVYTVQLSEAVYVLHAFTKKSTQGIKTPKRHMDLVDERLKMAREIDAEVKAAHTAAAENDPAEKDPRRKRTHGR